MFPINNQRKTMNNVGMLKELTINRFLHKRLPKPIPMNLNKILLLNKIIQLLIWLFSIDKGVSWDWDSILFKMLDFFKAEMRNKKEALVPAT